MKKYWYHFTFLILIIGSNKPVQAQFADDVYDKYTSVGQLGLAVTNFGVLGNDELMIGIIQPEEEILESWWKPRYLNYAQAMGVEFIISDLDENGTVTVELVD